MADFAKRVPENVVGDFFVDSTCINCDTCRQLAPAVFGDTSKTSFVKYQPEEAATRRSAMHALLACPVGSIGCEGPDRPAAAIADFPLLLEEPVYYCGFNSPKSYGGNAYFVRHPNGNWLVDSPKFTRPLVKRLEEFGGVDFIFLTHRDDVADAGSYAKHFGAQRLIDSRELDSQPDAEIIINGDNPTPIADDLLAIPTPGHTEGHCCLLFANRFLFTGDHLSWNRSRAELAASRNYCWYSWDLQRQSMNTLADYSFEWVLPGHGQRVNLPADEMNRHVCDLAARM